jgi:uncharacterized membrane protein YjjB (DUF3815 family)
MRWILWLVMAFAWGVQAALLWHGNSKQAALAAAVAAVLFVCIGLIFYRRDRRPRSKP